MRSLACAPETVRDHWPSGTSGGLLAPPKWSYGLSTLRWFLGLSALYLWSPVSAVAAACLLCRWPCPPACIFCLCTCKAMFHSTVTSLSLGGRCLYGLRKVRASGLWPIKYSSSEGFEACGWLLPACLPCLMHSLVFPPWVGLLCFGCPPRVLLEGKRSLLCL